MLLRDNSEKQVILNQNPLTKRITITIVNKITGKQRIYKSKRSVTKIFAECLEEELW